MIIVPGSVHPLGKKRDPVSPIPSQEIVVVDLKGALHAGWCAGEGRHQLALADAVVFPGLGGAALEFLVLLIRLECDRDKIEARLAGDFTPAGLKRQLRCAHQATLQIPAAVLTNTLTTFTPSPEDAVWRSAPEMVTSMGVEAG